MQKVIIVLLAVVLLAGLAQAQKPALEKPLTPLSLRLDLTENEPNDDCTVADYLTVDDNYSCAIDLAGDEDWFEVFYPAGGSLTFETHPGDAGDTKMYLYADDCSTELAFDDDDGEGYYSLIEYELPANTTVYVRVIHYSATGTGSYFLTCTEAEPLCPAPVNNTCAGALPLPFGSSFTVDNCGATNDYAMTSSGCTGYATSDIDIVYSVDLVEDQQLTVSAISTYDIAMYLITDCNDPEGSCVAGIDLTYGSQPETLIFDAGANPGTYYLILDGYSSTAHEGIWEVTVDGVVPTESTSFDSLKSMYR